MLEESGATNACTYASIGTSDVSFPADPLDHWSPPVSHFIINGASLPHLLNLQFVHKGMQTAVHRSGHMQILDAQSLPEPVQMSPGRSLQTHERKIS